MANHYAPRIDDPKRIGRRRDQDGPDLVLDHFLCLMQGPYAMLYAYLDESGTHQDSPVMCVAGILYDKSGMKLVNRLWKKELDQAGIRYFHKVDSAHLHGQFKGKSHEFTFQFYRGLIEIITKCNCGSVAVCVRPVGEFDVFREPCKYSQYTVCAFACMEFLLLLARKLGHKQVSFFIESGHENMGELRTVIKQKRAMGWSGVESYYFSDKEGLRPLQTADVFAYEVTKRMVDMIPAPPRRQLRKSLGAIIGKGGNHRIAVMTKELLWHFVSRMP